MKLIPIMEGARFSIVAIDVSNVTSVEECPAKEFISQMSVSSERSLVAILNRHKDHGPILNTQKSRLLEQGIYEFKTTQGDRVYYFYDGGQLTILTHGSIKPKKNQLPAEVAKAVELKNLYLRSKGVR